MARKRNLVQAVGYVRTSSATNVGADKTRGSGNARRSSGSPRPQATPWSSGLTIRQ